MWQTQGKEAGSQSQGSVGQNKVLRLKVSKPWPTGQNWPVLPSVSVNHALLEHSHTHSYLYRSTHGPGLLSGYSGRAKYVQQTPHSPQPETYTLWPFTEKVCRPLLWKEKGMREGRREGGRQERRDRIWLYSKHLL